MPIHFPIPMIAGAVLSSAITTASWAAPPSAPPTCFGETATIVGSPFESIIGTNDRDVVVSNGAETVNTGRGNDLLCITEAPEDSTYVTGAGNDRIIHVSEAAESHIGINPGAGKDEVIGGPWNEFILAAHGHNGHGDRDTISAGGGSDSVFTGGESAKGDTIDLGEGEDSVYIKRSPPAGTLTVIGAGVDNYLALDRPGNKEAGLSVLDNVTGQLTRDGTLIAQFEGFTSFGVVVHPQFTFTGTDAAEQLTVSPKQGSLDVSDWTFDLNMGGGDDTLSASIQAPDVVYDGGDGTDMIALGTGFGEDNLLFDMAAGTLQESTDGHTTTRTAIGFEDVAIANYAPTTILGTDGPNRLTITYGGETREPAVLDGRAGDDVLRGGFGDDMLIGGSGHDSADGGLGTDECLAEERMDCES